MTGEGRRENSQPAVKKPLPHAATPLGQALPILIPRYQVTQNRKILGGRDKGVL